MKLKCQTFPGSIFTNVRICCFFVLLVYIIVNLKALDIRLFIRQNKQIQWHFFLFSDILFSDTFIQLVEGIKDKLINNENWKP